jgi:hypothetical protein
MSNLDKQAMAAAVAFTVVSVAGILMFAQGPPDSPIDISDGSIHATVDSGWVPVTNAQVYKAHSRDSDSIDLEGFTHSSGPSAPTTASSTGGWLLNGTGGWVITITNADRPGNKKNRDSISVCSIDSGSSCGQPIPGDGHSVLIATNQKQHHGRWEEQQSRKRLNFHDLRGNCNNATGECNYVSQIAITSANSVSGANGDTYDCAVPEVCHIIIGR